MVGTNQVKVLRFQQTIGLSRHLFEPLPVAGLELVWSTLLRPVCSGRRVLQSRRWSRLCGEKLRA
jgi:hypothetical protein